VPAGGGPFESGIDRGAMRSEAQQPASRSIALWMSASRAKRWWCASRV